MDTKFLKEYYEEKIKPKPDPYMAEPGEFIVDERECYYYVLSGYGTNLRVAYDNTYLIRVSNISTLNGEYSKSKVAPKLLIDFVNDRPSKTFTEGMIVRARKGYRFVVLSSVDDYEMDLSTIAVVTKVGENTVTIGVSFKDIDMVFKEIEVKKDLLVEYTEEEASRDRVKEKKENTNNNNTCCFII